jgi:uncharacterized protein YbaA (DUF1428 family)
MKYVDGFVLVVPTKKLKAYYAMAKKGSKVWRKYGALDYKECVGDDLKTPMGLPFPKLTKIKSNESVVFSFIVYKSKAHRDQVNAKVMKDPWIAGMANNKEMPFDLKRMSYGGFKVLVDN